MSDHLIEQCKQELARLKEQEAKVLAAVQAAFPVGSRVMSYARSKLGNECTVVGHCGEHFSPEIGYVVLKNYATGKCHKAPIASEYTRVDLIERAAPRQGDGGVLEGTNRTTSGAIGQP